MSPSDDAQPIDASSPDDATTCAPPDDLAARRAALRDLAAMIGVEVFY